MQTKLHPDVCLSPQNIRIFGSKPSSLPPLLLPPFDGSILVFRINNQSRLLSPILNLPLSSDDSILAGSIQTLLDALWSPEPKQKRT